MNMLSVFFVVAFLSFVLMSIKNYKESIRDYLPRIPQENKNKAKKYILLENLLFMAMPESAMFGMAIMSYFETDITVSVFLIELITFGIFSILSIGLSQIYGEKVQNFIPKESQKSIAAK